jgi:molybdopterin-guanine dinucleotide biosynthesis protein A
VAGQADSAPNSDASDLVTGIILAGGRSRRLGRDKAQEPFCGQPLIRRVVERVEAVSAEIVVVVADSDRGKALPLGAGPRAARIVLDVYRGKGALGGIFSGLAAMRGDWGLVVACDMPFLNPTLLAYMLSLREGFDAVVPRPGAYPEPTHALYSKACLPYIEARLQADDLKVSRFYDQVRVNYLNEAAISPIDPGMRSFFNVNSPEDLAEALALESSPPIAEAS